MHAETPDWRSWSVRLCHPLPLVAVLLMAVNDHVLKVSGVVPPARGQEEQPTNRGSDDLRYGN